MQTRLGQSTLACSNADLSATGVVKTYKLTYEAVTVQHALFDRAMTQNQWTLDSRLLREIIEHFAPSAEQLDLSSENGRAVFTSFTTKITNGKGVQ
jgi:cell cycle checkpoint control protein RAD9A